MAIFHVVPEVVAPFYQPLVDFAVQHGAHLAEEAIRHPILFILEFIFILCLGEMARLYLRASATGDTEDIKNLKRSERPAHISHLAVGVAFAVVHKHPVGLFTSLFFILISSAVHNLAHKHEHSNDT